jgi:hypothetical protein
MQNFTKRYGISSKLQENILSYICRNPDGTYDTLAKYTNRNRRTIGQSVKTLEEHFYVEIQSIKEGKKRTKYLVIPSLKGIYYGLAYLEIRLEEVLRAYSDEKQSKAYFEHIQKIRDYTKWQEYHIKNSRLYFENNLFNEGMSIVTNLKEAFSIGFKIGLSGPNTSDTTRYFAEQGVGVMKDISAPSHLQDIKNFIGVFVEGINKRLKNLDYL